MVEGDDLSGEEGGVAEGDRGDHRPEPDAVGVAGQGAEEGPRLEVGVPRREQVVVDPGTGEAELLGGPEPPGQVLVGRAAEAKDPEAHAHPSRPRTRTRPGERDYRNNRHVRHSGPRAVMVQGQAAVL